MSRTIRAFRFSAILLIATPVLSGCIVSSAVDLATAPVRVGAAAVDLATTSQSEADENRGRAIRQREARLARLERQYAEESADCDEGHADVCEAARETHAQINALLPTVPVEPEA